MAAVFGKSMAAIDDRVTMVCDALARELAVLFMCSWYHGVSVFSGTWVNYSRAFRALRSIEMRASVGLEVLVLPWDYAAERVHLRAK